MSGRRVLLVDDEDDIRDIARMVLERLGGHTVHAAVDGAAGVAEAGRMVAAAQAPDVVLMDVQMPGLDGIDALARLRADEATRDLRVVMLTGGLGPGDAERLEPLDPAGVLDKPFDPMTLPARLADLLGW